MDKLDVVVIGGGLLGCSAARNLSRRKLQLALLEAREDVCTGISRANTAIVYPGYDHKPGTLKAELCVRANARFDALCRELDVPFSRCGSLMVSFGEKADAVLRKKYENGLHLGVPGLRLLTGKEASAMEPRLAAGVTSALYAPTAGTVNPWELGIAACENAAANGAELCLNTRVLGIRRTAEGYRVETDHGDFSCRAVVNCAGLAADRVQELLFPGDRSRPGYKMPDYEYVHKELQKNGVTLNLLWLEYCEKCREKGELPYQLTQFKKHYRDYAVKTNATMHLNHKPGEIMQGDWAGDTAEVIDNITARFWMFTCS